MSDPVWYRSLYWRIAFGFIALLAILLLVQGLLFLWLTDRFVGPVRTPAQLAALVASEVAAEVEQHPTVALEEYVRTHFSHIYQPFLVVFADGQRASNRPEALPPDMGRMIYPRMRPGPGAGRGFPGGWPPGSGPPPEGKSAGGQASGGRGGGDDRGGQPQRGGDGGAPQVGPPSGGTPSGGPGGRPQGGDAFGRRGGPRFPVEFASIVVNGAQVGMVAVPSNPPPVSVALQLLGPTLSWFGLGLLAVGATVTALLIFRPAHKRLRTLEQAARALGEGRTDVRATEAGGDEVSSLARTFNRMAVDLDSRAAALTESDRARRQLLADVSHELMTPLSAIRGYVETLGMPDVKLDAETRLRYLAIVEHETHKLEAIIGDLLDLARLEGGGDTLRADAVPVNELFSRIADRHQPAIRDRRITLVLDIAPGTPPIRGDAARLEQALQNLAANAIRHTPADGRVILTAWPDDGEVRMSVRDTGTGIPPQHLPRVFDRFYKVDASRAGTSVPSGSGLGLSIVRAIVERHGGTVAAANAPEGGALFELRLPQFSR
jgi:signal transduction histidine kinase